MPDIKEHIAYLSQEIGARPAGTEEEQQAALYITEQFQKQVCLLTSRISMGSATPICLA